MYNTIRSVDKNSPLAKLDLTGDVLLSINGHSIRDVLDYQFYSHERELTLTFQNAGEVRVEKEPWDDLGLNFEDYLMDKPTGCANKCVFCFVDQLPKGMRSTMYFKDDDARLSFLTGNYITCTNLSQRELQRICDLRISPLNISVHATDPELRCKLLGNKRGGEIMDILHRFAEAGITVDCQIVLVPDWNDGAALQKTMEDLASLYPAVNSVSIVPVGLTKHREGLTQLRPFDKAGAAAAIEQVEAFAELCDEKYGSHLFFCSDELYLRAEKPLPEDDYYEGYPQLENGVGLLRLMETEFRYAMEDETYVPGKPFAIATGVSAAPLMQKLVDLVGAPGRVYPIVNDFFGHTVDVAGLITGQDLMAQLKGKDLGTRLLISRTMMRHGEGIFLDDVTLDQLQQQLGVPVEVVDCDGSCLFKAFL